MDRLDSPSNPSIGAGAGDTGRISNAVVRARALDPIAAGTPDRNGDQEPHSSNARVAGAQFLISVTVPAAMGSSAQLYTTALLPVPRRQAVPAGAH